MVTQEWQQLWDRLQEKVDRMIVQLGDKCPGATDANGKYDDIPADVWVSGFWPGILWLFYDLTGDGKYKEKAWRWDEEIESWMIRENDLLHDVGFQFLNTAVMKYEMTGDAEGKRRGESMANFLAGRFNLAGRFIRAWKWGGDTGWAIIDCCMNLSLLFWASEVSGDPRFKHIAVAHADTVLKHFIRPDGSSIHIGSFDPETGEFLEPIGGQGYSPSSAWSRGQAWALYGLANIYRFTREERFLEAAVRVARYFIANLPADQVPYWDFRLPSFEGEPRDTAAAAIAASGLLEIAGHVDAEDGEYYRKASERIMRALDEQYAAWDEPEYEGILRGGTGNKPNNSQVNVSLIYGDYFFVEAAAKLVGWKRKIY